MATWQEVQGFIKSNYKVISDSGSLISMGFGFTDGRSQLIHVGPVGEWLRFASPVAKKAEVNVARLVEESKIFGVVDIGDYYALSHMQLLATVDAAEITEVLSFLAGVADEVEKAVTSGDEF